MNRYFILLCFLSLYLLGCSKNNPIDIQNEVFKNIFGELIENSVQDYRKMIIPSPELIKLWKEGKDTPKKKIDDKRKMLVVVNDSIRIPVIPTSENLNIESYEPSTLYKFNFNDFGFNTEDIQLISTVKYNENQKKMMDEYYFGGFLDISQIFFEEGLNKGYLYINYRLGKLNSQRSKIYIEKTNDKWAIVKVELISLS